MTCIRLAIEHMPEVECPGNWEYADHPKNGEYLFNAHRELLIRLRSDPSTFDPIDTRAEHGRMFATLAPAGYPYYAGNYRGSEHRCLRQLEVGVRSDNRVGYPADGVHFAMEKMGWDIGSLVAAIDGAMRIPDAQLTKADKLLYLVVVVSRIFVEFLTIHPYANGNGHMARMVVWIILGKYGFWPKRWPIEPRDKAGEYVEAIKKYRDGDYNTLENYMLRRILGKP